MCDPNCRLKEFILNEIEKLRHFKEHHICVGHPICEKTKTTYKAQLSSVFHMAYTFEDLTGWCSSKIYTILDTETCIFKDETLKFITK